LSLNNSWIFFLFLLGNQLLWGCIEKWSTEFPSLWFGWAFNETEAVWKGRKSTSASFRSWTW